MKTYVALYKSGFGADYIVGHRVSVPETDEDKELIAQDLKQRPKSAPRWAKTIAEAKEKLLAWVRDYRIAYKGEFKLVNEDSGAAIDDELAAAAAAKKSAKSAKSAS